MADIFADGIRSISVANGVMRVELAQMKRIGNEQKLQPQPVGTLILPVAAIKDFTVQFANAMQKVQETLKRQGGADASGGESHRDLDQALEKL
ncbi:MAG: hypothetical protein ACREDZ_10265 [Kiloniellales bacterium]